jgi:hypothetical protein
MNKTYLTIVALFFAGAGVASESLWPSHRASKHNPLIASDYAPYPFGMEGYLAQSDLVVRGVVSGSPTMRDLANPGWPARRGLAQFAVHEISVIETIYDASQHSNPPPTTIEVGVPAVGTEKTIYEEFPLPREESIFFLRRLRDDNDMFVLHRGANGAFPVSGDDVVHEAFGRGAGTTLLQRVRQLSSVVSIADLPVLDSSAPSAPDPVLTLQAPAPAVSRDIVVDIGDGGVPIDTTQEVVPAPVTAWSSGDHSYVTTVSRDGMEFVPEKMLDIGGRYFLRMAGVAAAEGSTHVYRLPDMTNPEKLSIVAFKRY